MRGNLRWIAACALLSALDGIVGCSSGSDPQLPAGGTITASIDGATFVSSGAYFTPHSSTSVEIEGYRNPELTTVTFDTHLPATLPATMGVTYGEVWLIDPVAGPPYRTVWYVHSGTCTFTDTSSGRLKGTFSFDATNNVYADVHVTNGVFDVCESPDCQ